MKFRFILILIFQIYISNVDAKKNGSRVSGGRNFKNKIQTTCEPRNSSSTRSIQSRITPDDSLEYTGTEKFYVPSNTNDSVKLRSLLSSSLRDVKEKRFWPKGEVPFVISAAYTTVGRNAILSAMKSFHLKTCVKFVARRSQEAYIKFEPEEKCETKVGMQGGEQKVILGKLCFEAAGWTESVLMNVLGFYSDHMMPIRDKYVEILYQNIPKRLHPMYRKLTSREWATLQIYEYQSLVHAPNFVFQGFKGQPFKSKSPVKHVFGGPTLTNLDAVKINHKYKCHCKTYTNYDPPQQPLLSN